MSTANGTEITLPKTIFFTSDPKQSLEVLCDELKPDQVVFLVDEHTRKECLVHFGDIEQRCIIEIKSGEINKNLDTCSHVWRTMTSLGLTRKSLLVNVGGGVIGDLGGFCAATYKRGIRFVNFPTTLLAMVDANIGGKLGIDFEGFKNHIGVFLDPNYVVIYDGFLKTLPSRELRSGFAEVLKHGLIRDKAYWNNVKSQELTSADWRSVVKRSAELKYEVVTIDPKESGLRKILNFGHTLGHAIETHYLLAGKSLLHGEAIAAGMILEGFLAMKKGLLDVGELTEIREVLIRIYGTVSLPPLSDLMPLMLQDKKNIGKFPSFSLIGPIGNCHFDLEVTKAFMEESFSYYQSIK